MVWTTPYHLNQARSAGKHCVAPEASKEQFGFVKKCFKILYFEQKVSFVTSKDVIFVRHIYVNIQFPVTYLTKALHFVNLRKLFPTPTSTKSP